MEKSKYKCPKCGSTDLVWWVEAVMEEKYKLNPDGTRQRRRYSKSVNYECGNEGVECLRCGESTDNLSLMDLDCKWINEVES